MMIWCDAEMIQSIPKLYYLKVCRCYDMTSLQHAWRKQAKIQLEDLRKSRLDTELTNVSLLKHFQQKDFLQKKKTREWRQRTWGTPSLLMPSLGFNPLDHGKQTWQKSKYILSLLSIGRKSSVGGTSRKNNLNETSRKSTVVELVQYI